MTQFFSLFHKSAFQLLGASPQPPESFWAERLFGTLGFFLDDLGSFYPYVFALSCQTSPHVVIFLQALFTVVFTMQICGGSVLVFCLIFSFLAMPHTM